jgi:hypothetical protein
MIRRVFKLHSFRTPSLALIVYLVLFCKTIPSTKNKMKQIIFAITICLFTACGQKDGLRRNPDPRFKTQSCVNDTAEQESFDMEGKVYFEYIPCDQSLKNTPDPKEAP